MNKEFMVAPSILSADFGKLGDEIVAVMAAGADWIHVDVMDGHFVPNLTLGAPIVKSLRKIKDAFLDCHLMIEEPEKYVDDFLSAGADNITLHIESKGDIPALLKKIKNAGCKAGITLRPATNVAKVVPLLSLVDVVLVMTVNPGFGGQSFMQNQVDKISKLRKEIDQKKLPVLIQVDGGVNNETKKYLADVDVLVAGSYIFKNDYAQAIKNLKEKS